MTISWIHLVVTVIGLGFTLQALRPIRFPSLFAVPSFFAGWLTNELVVHHLIWQAAATAFFVSAGSLGAWPGWVAIALTIVQWAGNMVILRDVFRSRLVIEDALVAGLGEGYREAFDNDPISLDEIRAAGIILPRFRNRNVKRTKDIVFTTVAARDLKLDVFRHKDHADADRRPVVLYFHGGAWIISSKDEQGRPLMLEMAARGWVGVNANYRLSPWARFPDHLIDCKRAVAWIREHADEIGADPSFIAVVGGSAGGHLSALVALTSDDPDLQPGFEDADTSVQAAVPFYGVYDFTDRSGEQPAGMLEDFLEPHVMQARLADEPELFALASPLDQVHADAPPTFVIHGERDTLASVTDARRFAEALRDAGVTTVHAELPGAQHAFDVFPSIRTSITLLGVARFLEWTRLQHDAAFRGVSSAVGSERDHHTTNQIPSGQP